MGNIYCSYEKCNEVVQNRIKSLNDIANEMYGQKLNKLFEKSTGTQLTPANVIDILKGVNDFDKTMKNAMKKRQNLEEIEAYQQFGQVSKRKRVSKCRRKPTKNKYRRRSKRRSKKN